MNVQRPAGVLEAAIGNAECPPLPEGFKLERHEHRPLVAIDPAGKRYVVCLNPNALYAIKAEDANGKAGYLIQCDPTQVVPL